MVSASARLLMDISTLEPCQTICTVLFSIFVPSVGPQLATISEGLTAPSYSRSHDRHLLMEQAFVLVKWSFIRIVIKYLNMNISFQGPRFSKANSIQNEKITFSLHAKLWEN